MQRAESLRVCWTGAPVSDDVRRCEVRANGHDHSHPHHQVLRCSDSCRREDGFRLIDVLSCKALLNNIIKKADAEAGGFNHLFK